RDCCGASWARASPRDWRRVWGIATEGEQTIVVSRLVWCVSYREQLLTRFPTLYTGVVSPKYFEKATAVVVAPEP
ncbi:MAG TPA: hypothetical protein VGL00_03715, partial [Terracidiphilus sp.]